MKLPVDRGPLSRHVISTLSSYSARPTGGDLTDVPDLIRDPKAVIEDDDVQLALWVLYELAYRGFEEVPADCEWDGDLIRLRRALESAFEQQLREAVAPRIAALSAPRNSVPAIRRGLVEGITSLAGSSGPSGHRGADRVKGGVAVQLIELIEADVGASVASFLQRSASKEQVVDYLRERSIQQLKESDPHSFVLPRIDGPAKAALAELQYDEYGSGRGERLHATLYANALSASGLEPTYGAYLDETSALSLACANLMSLFGLNRRLRGAAMGHLAAFEATSSVPSRRIAAGIERVGLSDTVAAYFYEHVEADAVHEQVAVHDICGTLVAGEPHLHDDVLFGAACCLHLADLSGTELLRRWSPPLESAHLEVVT